MGNGNRLYLYPQLNTTKTKLNFQKWICKAYNYNWEIKPQLIFIPVKHLSAFSYRFVFFLLSFLNDILTFEIIILENEENSHL